MTERKGQNKMKHKQVIKAFDIIEMVLILGAGFILLKVMWDFSHAMEAWSTLHSYMIGVPQ
jgi:hypothetical protein|tara:strand:+ start:1057 stop:1239 length:183 start_codon:yes stop_codon:yes gene_type:complete